MIPLFTERLAKVSGVPTENIVVIEISASIPIDFSVVPSYMEEDFRRIADPNFQFAFNKFAELREQMRVFFKGHSPPINPRETEVRYSSSYKGISEYHYYVTDDENGGSALRYMFELTLTNSAPPAEKNECADSAGIGASAAIPIRYTINGQEVGSLDEVYKVATEKMTKTNSNRGAM
jgi:hypothetical protein